MRTPPQDFGEPALRELMAQRWRLTLDRLRYEPVGFGSHHWSATASNGSRWFLTVDDLTAKRRVDDEPVEVVFSRLRAALTAARAARDAGLTFVVAPVPDQAGEVVARLGPIAAAVYPFVEGTSHAYGAYDSMDDRLAVLGLLVDLHGATPAAAAVAAVDDLDIPCRAALVDALDEMDQLWSGGPYAERARALLVEHGPAVERLLARYDALATGRPGRSGRLVLTHGEPHVANVMRTPQGWSLLDWDTACMAEPERDLWMLETGDGTICRAYTDATGVAVDPAALELYRLWWDLTEIATYVRLFREPHEASADVEESWENLVYYLDPATRWPELA